MHNKDTKFDFIAFYIGFSMLITTALIIVAIVFMFNEELTETQANMWKFLIGIFGSMFFANHAVAIFITFSRKNILQKMKSHL